MSLVIDVQFPGGKKIDAKIGDVLINTDQSVMAGGEGSAPEPFQLFLASIATCAGIYASNSALMIRFFSHSRQLHHFLRTCTHSCTTLDVMDSYRKLKDLLNLFR